MKNLYHLLVTSYKLQVTRFTAHLLPHTSHLLPHTSFLFLLFCFLPAAALAQKEATITDLDFSCSGKVTVTYDLKVCDFSVDVTLKYSPDKCDWFLAESVTGDLTSQTTGTGKTIVWDNDEDDVSFGRFYFKVEYTLLRPEPTPVYINGVLWSPVNLDFGGWFCENPWDYGALYQWGRLADGHECRTSATTTTLSSTDDPGHSNFIVASSLPNDWRTPLNNALWNSGTEIAPKKTIYDPCPDGWRVPTRTELNSLLSTVINGSGPLETYPSTTINGRWFGDGGAPSLFLPAANYRNNSSGFLTIDGTYGGYWSSTPIGVSVYGLRIWSASYDDVNPNVTRASGMSVRCVKE